MKGERVRYGEFLDRFSREEACSDYLYQVKWPNGFVCPRCGHRHAYCTATRRLPLYECAHCHHQTSLIVGTVMEGSRTKLTKWFMAFYLISSPESISALQLSKEINVTYKTAWLLLHKIRHAMSEEDISLPLSGSVYVNRGDYGRVRTLRDIPKKRPLFVGVSINETNEPVYVKMKMVADNNVDKGPVLTGIRKMGQKAFMVDHIKSQPSHLDFSVRYQFKNREVFNLFQGAKKWMIDTFHGLGGRHLQAYFDEFCYRINLKLNKEPVFENLVHLCTTSKRVNYFDLTGRWSPVSFPVFPKVS